MEKHFQTHKWTNAKLLVYVHEGIGHIDGIKDLFNKVFVYLQYPYLYHGLEYCHNMV